MSKTRLRYIQVLLVSAVIFGFFLLPQVAMAASQTWYLTNTLSGSNYVMQTSNPGGTSSVSLGKGASAIWVAQNAAAIKVSFPAATWSGAIHHTGSNLVNPVVLDIGVWNVGASSFTSYGSTSGSMAGGATWSFSLSASAFVVVRGEYLAFKVWNNSGQNRTLIVATDGTSFVSSPSSDPGYPGSWGSFNAAGGSSPNDEYDTAGENTAYMYGTGFTNGAQVRVIFWDGDGTACDTRDLTLTGTTVIDINHPFNPSFDTAGDWHVVVYSGFPVKTSYNAGDADIIADDTSYDDPNDIPDQGQVYSFVATAVAIPEIPTVIAGIAVAGTCFGLYWWMRKRARVQRVCRVY